ncbi:hypothetical protein SDRG_16548 [Saprolegnia diclina VS20]|uniref:Uncharacterized protein n=1 Tax=Saprolegnia diclina (strain VS20) TaxID=1156394 RepID=T0R0S9_SAPDV|nr:hypothetical protein SDRG_16548 [Saprolegnia diclina VS20]EQC25578.1 hypothetical protein SDRG_16548 [Saprolegnia diclina VS20]|eukprot:XP_008620985.1 hypothetical protein SDRG_16548 [Saprolegnia diclina VS20]
MAQRRPSTLRTAEPPAELPHAFAAISTPADHHARENEFEQETRVLVSNKKIKRSKHPSAMRAANYVEDPTPLILKACEAPVGRSLAETFKLKKAKDYTVHQFGLIQERVGMHPRTLKFDAEYEVGYLAYVQESSVVRVRLTFIVGSLFLGALLAYEAHLDLFRRRAGIPPPLPEGELPDTNRLVLYILSFGVSVPAFFIGFLLTFFESMHKRIERITFAVFFVVAMTLIFKKPVQAQTGPVLPLMILIIPIFGITRMRFLHSCVLGWTIFFTYLLVQGVSLHWMDPIPYGNGKTWKYDNISDIIYQTINYGIAIIGGMVSHYRQELIRRRNYALKLPFTGLDDDEPLDLFGKSYSEEHLMDTCNLSFRNHDVEEAFCRMWYLIDPHPYENPNRGDIHENVYMTIRFAVLGVFLSQVVLGIQDIKLLFMKDFKFEYSMAVIVRFAIVVPLYLLSFYFMYLLGRKYFEMYLRKASNVVDESGTESDVDANHVTIAILEQKRALPPSQSVKERLTKQTEALVATKGGYVRSAQIFATGVLVLQMGATMVLLLQVGRSFIVTHSDKQLSATKPNVYFMGFLNAILFAHRSGFKVRYVYAARVSWAMVLLFVFFASHYLTYAPWPYLWAEYSCYLVAVQFLGMMISHEEESLRRSFFVLKSMRMLEFEKWFAGVLRIQKGVRKFLARHRSSQRSPPPPPPVERVAHAQSFLAMASKMGVQAQAIQIAVVLFDVLYSVATA